jgi:hypothetical protein
MVFGYRSAPALVSDGSHQEERRIWNMTDKGKLPMVPVILAALVLGFSVGAVAQEAKKRTQEAEQAHHDLASQATNPAAALIQLQLQDLYTPDSDNSSGYANSGIIQPVYPFVLGKDHFFQAVVARLTVPIVTTPKVGGDDHHTGLGDSTLLLVPTHKVPLAKKGEFWTAGPVFAGTFPTASLDVTGSEKTSLGPGGLFIRNFTGVFSQGDSLLAGVLAYQTWSVAGSDSRANVSKTFGQPLLVYHFDKLFDQKGWYARLPDDLWQYDWNEGEMFQVPLGAGFGKVFTIGKQPVNAFVQSWYNPADSDLGASPNYTFKFNLTFLFPE